MDIVEIMMQVISVVSTIFVCGMMILFFIALGMQIYRDCKKNHSPHNKNKNN